MAAPPHPARIAAPGHEDGGHEDFVKTGRQPEVTAAMRETVAEWLLAVCEEEAAHPALFCLAVNCLDRVMAKIEIKAAQLQLLAAACLLVSWKVRELAPVSAVKIVKYTSCSVKVEELLEWEVYILAKLNWNIPGVVASDFVDHILKNLAKLKLGTPVSVAETRSSVQLLVRRCHVSYELSRHPPILLAAASVLATLTPLVTAETETSSASLSASPPPRRETEAPSLSQSSATSSPELSRLLSPSYDSTRSPFQVAESPITPIARRLSSGGEDATPARSRGSEVDRVTRAIQRLTLLDSHALASCSAHLQQLELLAPTQTAGHSDTSASGDRFSTSSPLPTAARSLFKDLETTVKTPTKILDASTSITN